MMASINAECLFYGTVPKPGEDEKNCQDACSVNQENSVFSIADGVTKSFFPGNWAQLLVSQFTINNQDALNSLFSAQDWQDWLAPIQTEWEIQVKRIVSQLNEAKHVYMRNQLATREPAASTFIGLRKKPNTNGKKWQVIIIGDSCLFHFSKSRLSSSYPFTKTSEFNSHPKAFASYKSKSIGEPKFININAEEGDYFLLATDALSKWLLLLRETNEKYFLQVVSILLSLRSHQKFETVVNDARKLKDYPLESDDVGLIVLALNKQMEVPESKENTVEDAVPISSPVPALDGELPNLKYRQIDRSDQIQKKNELAQRENTREVDTPRNTIKWIVGLLILGILLSTGYWFIAIEFNHTKTPKTNSSGFLVPAGEQIYHQPTFGSIVLFRASKEFPALVLESRIVDGYKWQNIEFSTWIGCAKTDTKPGIIEIKENQNAFASFSESSGSIGTITANTVLVVSEQVTLDEQTWCHLKVKGYIFVGNGD